MKKQNTEYIWLIASIISFLLLAVSFLLMPIENRPMTDSTSAITLFAGLLFWISFVSGIVTQIILSQKIKKWLIINNIRRGRFLRKHGIVSFFQNPLAIVADVTTVVGLIGLVTSIWLTHGIGYINYIFLALFVFSFSMHCVLNGKIVYILRNKDKIQQTLQEERANQNKK